MKRRDFLMGAVAATSLTAVRRGRAQAPPGDKLSRIAIMMFGLNSIVKTNMPPAPERTIELMDIGQLCADRFKVHNVELQSNYFPSTEMSWLKDFKARLDKTKTKVVQINVELGTGLNMGADAPCAGGDDRSPQSVVRSGGVSGLPVDRPGGGCRLAVRRSRPPLRCRDAGSRRSSPWRTSRPRAPRSAGSASSSRGSRGSSAWPAASGPASSRRCSSRICASSSRLGSPSALTLAG